MQPISSLPLSVAEIDQMVAFSSAEPQTVRALLYLLDAAWRSDVPGTLSSNLDGLARVSRLSEEQLQSRWDTLFDGWVLREDGRLAYPKLCEVWERMTQHYGDALRRLELAVLVMQADGRSASPEAFDLISPAPEVKSSPTKGKRLYPNDFQPNETSREAMARAGYHTPEEAQWLLGRFADYGKAQRRMYADWQATFRNFLGGSITINDFRAQFGYSPGAQARAAPSSALQRLRQSASTAPGSAHAARPVFADTFAQRQLGNARTMFTAAAAQRGMVQTGDVSEVEMPMG